jgi:hypothetical protein
MIAGSGYRGMSKGNKNLVSTTAAKTTATPSIRDLHSKILMRLGTTCVCGGGGLARRGRELRVLVGQVNDRQSHVLAQALGKSSTAAS